MTTGTIIKFDEIRGYGFVSPDTGGEDVFIHVNDLSFDKHLVTAGAQVEYVTEEGERGLKASRVRLLSQPHRVPAAKPTSAPVSIEDGLCDVLSSAELTTELTEALLSEVPSLTGGQLVSIRQCVVALAKTHRWIED
ncbi:cold-shock protein [Amycolatopsis sp. NPDC049868]|uniref:cold-shock protein n=1 Tax=Amycolatopsis sp. NPDC049868 TaxID=3363934 RepID=UPI003788B238